MSKKLRLLSFVMMIFILAVSLPMYAFAMGIDTEAEEITVDNTTYVLKELTDKREANVKYYLLSDRTSRAVVYPYDVHYLDENGKWQDIDNTLTLSSGNYEAKGKTEVKFAKKSGSTGLVSIKDGGYKIDFTPLNASKSTAKITNSEKTDSRKFDEIKLLSGIKSEVLYEDIYENTDIQYVLEGLSLKENIVVKAARDSYSYEIELKLNGLKAELEGHVPKHGFCQGGTIQGFRNRSVNQIWMLIFSKLINFYYLFGCAGSPLLSMGFLKL